MEANVVTDGVCAICGNGGVNRWTISMGGEVAILDLCTEHDKPLRGMLYLGEVVNEKQEVNPRAIAKRQLLDRFEHLDWTPPD